MNYRFLMLSDEIDDFRREYKINAESTFLDLHNIIVESVGYKGNEMSSFVICDEEWNREAEITLVDMGTSAEEDIILMESTLLRDYLEVEKQKLLFVFDYLSERAFYLELREIFFGEDLSTALVSRKEGAIPEQFIDFVDDLDISKVVQSPTILDDDFYGDDMYNEDELDYEGFDGLDNPAPAEEPEL